jgi:hypothetical protein
MVDSPYIKYEVRKYVNTLTKIKDWAILCTFVIGDWLLENGLLPSSLLSGLRACRRFRPPDFLGVKSGK